MIFIHDLTDNRQQTWAINDIMWPKDLLPVELPSIRVLTFGYDGRVTHLSEILSAWKVRKHAQSLLEAIADLRGSEMEKPSCAETRPIIFCAHGLGGLICEQALVVAEAKSDPLWSLTRGVMLFGVPHFRAGIAEWAVLVATSVGILQKRVQKKGWAPFRQDITDLVNMQRKFCDIVDQQWTDGGIEVSCFYELIPMPGKLMISPEWAILPKFRSIPRAISDHIDMTKFEVRNGYAYLYIVSTLHKWLSAEQRDLKELGKRESLLEQQPELKKRPKSKREQPKSKEKRPQRRMELRTEDLMEEQLTKVPTRLHDQPILAGTLQSDPTIDADNLPHLFNDTIQWFDSVCVLKQCMPGVQIHLLKFDNAQLRLSRWGKAAGLASGRIDSLSHPWNADSKLKARNIFRDIVRAFELYMNIGRTFREGNFNIQLDEATPFGPDSNPMCQYLHKRMQTISNSRQSYHQGSQKDKILISEDRHLVDLTKKFNELIDRLYELLPSLKDGLAALAQLEYAEFFNVSQLLETVAEDYDLRAEVRHTIEGDIQARVQLV
ncbi:hypothetical protein GGR51DRAFT_557786 [Nemania sp. FL0031]|nr:hypothetical protein GGR51DRAFT_557786 [Nemania sp. FL0031]